MPVIGNTTTDAENRLLIVDAETIMCELMQFKLEDEGFKTVVMHDGHEALNLDVASFGLILVDLMGREFDGFKFTQSVKSNPGTYNVPVIIISSRTSEDDVVNGLDAGADDFVSKPFSMRELIARIRSVMRRKRMMSARRAFNVIRFRELVLDMGSGSLTIAGEPVSISRTEYLILAMFLRQKGHFFDRSQIKSEAWQDEEVSDRAVDTTISRLRKKLGEYGQQIVNRQGFGYGFLE